MPVPIASHIKGSNPDVRSRPSRLLLCMFAVTCCLYAVQLWSPLRLSGDSIELLSIASSAADGHGYLDHGQQSRYWPGYPAVVVFLQRIGAGRSWGLIALNALFLLIALASAYYVAREYFQLDGKWSLGTLLFTMLSFVVVKHFTLPLTDIPFLGISMSAVALLVRAEAGSRYWSYWFAALVLSIAAFLVRPVGIALFPALVWSLAVRAGALRILRRSKPVALAVCGLCSSIVAAVLISLIRTRYMQDALSIITGKGVGRSIVEIGRARVNEFGELILNIPASKLGPFAPLVWIAGVAAAAIFVACAYRRRGQTAASEIYLLAYTGIMLVWPYFDTRFWIPVLPLMSLAIASEVRAMISSRRIQRGSTVYAVIYMGLGFCALAYSTRITFSGRNFPNRYGDGHLRLTYVSFYSGSAVDPANVNPAALELLDRYSPHN